MCAELVGVHGRHPLTGTYAEVADAVGITPRQLDDVYGDRADMTASDRIELDHDRLAALTGALALGDAAVPEPYAYVGPWTSRAGESWNQPFGAAQPLSGLATADELAVFFREGSERAAADPVAQG